ncbi:MAG: hypothetical protein U0694_02965 [Anaerolineae bacterium]
MILTQERIDRFVSALQEQGIEVQVTADLPESFSYGVGDTPQGVDVGGLLTQAYDAAFYDFIDGPWTFTVEVPGA